MAFSDIQLEDLRSRADLVSLLGRRVTLRKTGKDYVGLCPFHGEKSPSFYVVPGKQLWHCFGCGETGDVFKFYMKLDGMPFVDAVALVARESGVILLDEKLDPEEARRRAHLDELAALLERAVKFYEQKLWHDGGKAAREHLGKRGVKEESVRRFQLGFGGLGMDELSRALEKAGASAALAVEAGLLVESTWGGRPIDRFHGRLIVPIRVPRPPNGRAVALGGRFLEGVTPSRPDKKVAKYINSPETPLYHKGSVLFGLDVARDSIRKTERAVIVEGYFDVIGVHQAGLPLAVATCGTSLTAGHLELLLRTGAKELVFLFDGDEAGMRAAQRAAELCAKAQVPAKVATLPQGLDPDEFARQRGLEGLQALLDRGRPAIEHLIEHALSEAGPNASVEERVRAVQAVRPVVLAAPDGLSRELYVAQIAERLKVSVGAVQGVLYAEADPEAPAPRRREEPRDRAREPEGDGAQEAAATEAPLASRASSEPRAGPRAAPPAKMPPPPPTSNAEVGIAIALLKFPALAPVVAQQGVLADFAGLELRALGEAVLAAQAEGVEVAAATHLSAVLDPRLRAMLEQQLAQEDASLDEASQRLVRVLDKLHHEVRKKKALAAQMASRVLPADAQARRQFEAEQNRLLDESRTLHLRMRERDRPK